MESRAVQALVMFIWFGSRFAYGLQFTVCGLRLRVTVQVTFTGYSTSYDYGLRVPFTVWLRISILQRCSAALRLNQR